MTPGHLAAEYATATNAPPCQTCYLSRDHLGSVRLVTYGIGNVVARHDYLPFGEEVPANTAGRNARFGVTDYLDPKFTWQIRDSESGLDFQRPLFQRRPRAVHQSGSESGEHGCHKSAELEPVLVCVKYSVGQRRSDGDGSVR
jgi:hypothetical protein